MDEMRRGETTQSRTYRPADLPGDGSSRATHAEERRHEETFARDERALGAGSAIGAAAGAGAAALAIIGLAGVSPLSLLAIACVVAGGGLLFGGSAAGPRARELHGRARAEIVGGLGAETLGGAAGVVLGILALIGIAPLLLEAIAAIALGGAMLLSTVVPARERLLGSADARVARAGEGAGAVQGLVGVGAVALGILALVGIAPRTLALVSLLGIGAGMMLSGTALLAGATLAERHASA